MIAREKLDGTRGMRFVRIEYPLPRDLTEGTQVITFRFVNQQALAGRVFGCSTAAEAKVK